MNKIETAVVKPTLEFFENGESQIILDNSDENALDNKIIEIDNYIQNNTGSGKDELIKDELYKKGQDLWKEYVDILRPIKYNFYLNRKQYVFLTDLLMKKMEYDVDTIFVAIELTNLLGNMSKMATFKGEKDNIAFKADATEITYIYHLIAKHKVKGLSASSYTFAQILEKIGKLSKIFNYYDECSKRTSSDIQKWAFSFEPTLTEATEVLEETKSVEVE